MGSSIDTMCCRRVWLMWPSIEARVVVLPDPVAPVTRTRPRCSSASFWTPGRQPEAAERRHLGGDDAACERDVAALAERIDAEPRQARKLVGGVELAGLVEDGDPPGGRGADLVQDLLELLARQRLESLELLELAVDPDDRGLADLQVHVARVETDGNPHHLVQVHVHLIGRKVEIV